MAGRTPTCGTDELPVSTVRRDAAADDHPERREGGNQTHGTHDVLAAGKQTHRITSKIYLVRLWLIRGSFTLLETDSGMDSDSDSCLIQK